MVTRDDAAARRSTVLRYDAMLRLRRRVAIVIVDARLLAQALLLIAMMMPLSASATPLLLPPYARRDAADYVITSLLSALRRCVSRVMLPLCRDAVSLC